MKFLISIFLFPSFVSILLAAGCFFFYRFGVDNPLVSEMTSKAHMLKGFMYMSMGLGLPLAVFSTVTAIFLTVCSFVFKSWTRALLSLAIGAAGGYIWLYFVNVSFPG